MGTMVKNQQIIPPLRVQALEKQKEPINNGNGGGRRDVVQHSSCCKSLSFVQKAHSNISFRNLVKLERMELAVLENTVSATMGYGWASMFTSRTFESVKGFKRPTHG